MAPRPSTDTVQPSSSESDRTTRPGRERFAERSDLVLSVVDDANVAPPCGHRGPFDERLGTRVETGTRDSREHLGLPLSA